MSPLHSGCDVVFFAIFCFLGEHKMFGVPRKLCPHKAVLFQLILLGKFISSVKVDDVDSA